MKNNLPCYVVAFFICFSSLWSFARASINTTEPCDKNTWCEDCTQRSDCVWCPDDYKCLDGGPFGSRVYLINVTCSGWRWRQCSMKGSMALIVGAILILVLLVLVCACCCWLSNVMCKGRRLNQIFKLRSKKAYEEMEENKVYRTPITDLKRDELLRKYSKRIFS
eukprot:TRINITY_DN1462_c0_g2_i4.p1 TRINITY_DN1462_c0_g2~~TRINITY_DN1462_c0_g2_i4.p1  ORF type:complete len:165 (-),score=10.68 TRINITY_DN1462_c0_g2_i4:158-652(-)